MVDGGLANVEMKNFDSLFQVLEALVGFEVWVCCLV